MVVVVKVSSAESTQRNETGGGLSFITHLPWIRSCRFDKCDVFFAGFAGFKEEKSNGLEAKSRLYQSGTGEKWRAAVNPDSKRRPAMWQFFIISAAMLDLLMCRERRSSLSLPPNLPVCVSPVNHACTHPVEPGYRAQHLNTQPPSPSCSPDVRRRWWIFDSSGQMSTGWRLWRTCKGGQVTGVLGTARCDVLIIGQLGEWTMLTGRSGSATLFGNAAATEIHLCNRKQQRCEFKHKLFVRGF